ncbi:hypothetical protein NMG60_11035515 [Bertholletia excelsa]
MELDLENPLPILHDLFRADSVPALFRVESDHMTSHGYAQCLEAADLDISVRREAVSLILHCSSNFDPFLPYLAINYLDRFLSAKGMLQIKPWVVGLLAVSCVSLALKMREIDFSISDIQGDEGFIFDTQTIQRMELLILGALQWRMRSITPFSFINFFISLFKFKDPPLLHALKARATEIIFKAQNDTKLLEFRPSIIAASALLSASHELFPLQFPCFQGAVSSCSYVNKEKLLKCCNVMKDVAMDGYESVLEGLSSSGTPVSVLDRRCSSPSFGDEKTETSEGNTITGRLDRDTKRRKISSFRNDNSLQLSQIQQC